MNSDCETTQVIVKNTFIEHVLPKPVQRRCASVPSSLRLNNGNGKVPEDEQLFKGWEADAALSPISDASTDSGAASDEESVDSAPTTASSSMVLWTPDNKSLPVEQVQSVLVLEPQVEHMLSFFPQQAEQKQEIKLNSQAEAFTPAATKLSTQAKLFTPGCCLRQKPPGTKLNANARKRCARFRWQCQEVIAAAKEAMAACMFVQGVELVVEKSSWSINAYVSPEHYQCKEQVLSKAKQALLDTAENSQGVYVMGYRGKPFMATPGGFFAILGVMTCVKQACWDTFCYGHCNDEATCTLQHPVYQVPVYINIEFNTGY